MHYILEAFFVGIYCGILYEILVNFITDYHILLFILGFFKHFMGYEAGLHGLFCKFGYSCQRVENSNIKTAYLDLPHLTMESVAEGFAFLTLGYLFSMFSRDRLLNVFLIGAILHIAMEITGLHKKVCHRCIPDLRGPLFEPLLFQATSPFEVTYDSK
jgi:hypothetical protein